MKINQQDGYTLPELLAVIIITALFTGIIFTFTVGYWRYGYKLEADLDTLTTRLNAGDFLRDAVGSSTGLIIQNSIVDAKANNPDPAIPSADYWVPIHAIPGNKPIGAKGTTTPLIYFRRPSVNSAGSYIMNGNLPYEDEYVLYLDGNSRSLMQRSLANPDAPANRLKTSCPPSVATALCPADKTLATDLASVDMRYFSRTGNLIDYTSVKDTTTGAYIGPDFTSVEVVEFSLNLTKKTELQKSDSVINNTKIRIALRNA